MKIIKLADFADDGVLSDAEDGSFFARKLGPEDQFDFTGLTSVSAAFLDALLAGLTSTSIEGRVIGAVGAVDEALGGWLDRQGGVAPIEKPSRPPVRATKPTPRTTPKVVFERRDDPNERYTPMRLAKRLREQLASYIESAYPLNEPTLVRSRRKLLQETDDGHLLAQEPFVETTPRYRSFAGNYTNLDLAPHIADLFTRLASTPQQFSDAANARPILYPQFYDHQARAYRAFLGAKKDIIVATGTGSGKTECFLIPMLGTLIDEATTRPASFAKPGVRALILYPMNALVNDQLGRLRLLFGEPSVASAFHDTANGASRHPTFGMYTGRTPYPGPRTASKDSDRAAPLLQHYLGMEPELVAKLQSLGRYPAKDLEAFFAKDLEIKKIYQSGKKKGKSYTDHQWDQRLHTNKGDRELLMRQEMVRGAGSRPGAAPDILVTNYSMLEYMLMRPFERPIFDQTRQWLAEEGNQFILVVDEAHMYRGAKGAEVAFLLRRLRARLGIHDRPDKLRVICTSASLGNDVEALQRMTLFAADLTGKPHESFESITGVREVPAGGTSAEPAYAELLAEIDLDKLHASAGADSLRAALSPLFEYSGSQLEEGLTEPQIMRRLHDLLKNSALTNLLLAETAGRAVSMSALSDKLFPGAPRRERAVQTLLTLGALARPRPDDPGLVPTRMHMMFRGLPGIYACIDPCCSGRQDGPGQPAGLGRLYVSARTNCDSCGGRVFELASCRNCGAPYLLGYRNGSMAEMSFIWGETEGQLETVQLMPQPPRWEKTAHELRVHIKTGFIDTHLNFPEGGSRSLWVALDGDSKQSDTFPRCGHCQPPSSHAKARIYDFTTRGEQPFTVLVDAQFAEQPPQAADPEGRLPNKGRKVLVFSDGRQKAARLAPALEHAHARDQFRQVLVLAADALTKLHGEAQLGYCYAAVVKTCVERGIDLFPAADEEIFKSHLERARHLSLPQLTQQMNAGQLAPTESYARQLFAEVTDRFYSFGALGLATIREHSALRPYLLGEEIPGLPEPERMVLFRSWLRLQLEARRFLPPGADIVRLGEGWELPEGLDITKPANLFPLTSRAYIESLLDADGVTAVTNWLTRVVRESGLFELQNDLYFLKPHGLCLELAMDRDWYRCVGCGRLHIETLNDSCPACLAEVTIADESYMEARTGFYRAQIRRAFDESSLEPFGLVAEEHSAQLNGRDDQSAFSRLERYELRFQDIPLLDKVTGHPEPPVDVLSCTTTMEVGIDIGALTGVALRNVPPQVANYQQRAGRAGRRGRSVASVITYAHGNSHDAHFFAHPAAIIAGDVAPPEIYIENQKVLRRHINAYLIQRFFHETVKEHTATYLLFESLGTVEQFLSEDHDCCLSKLEKWLRDNADQLVSELRHWVPTYGHGRKAEIEGVEHTIATAVTELDTSLKAALPIAEYANRDRIEGLERESLERRLEDKLLDLLIDRAVLPRYAFPTDVVGFWVSKRPRKGDPKYKRTFEYEPQRDLQIALAEYAPGSSLTIDKKLFSSAAIYSPYQSNPAVTLRQSQHYAACRTCGWVSLEPDKTAIASCPCCRGTDLMSRAFVTPAGFAPDINIKPEPDRGGAPDRAGYTSPAQLEVRDLPTVWDTTELGARLGVVARVQELVKVNKGLGDRGFMICPDCGRTEPVFGPGFVDAKLSGKKGSQRHQNPLEVGVTCDGRGAGPYFLGYKFPTDVLLLKLTLEAPATCPTADTPGSSASAGRIALTSLVEALCLGASRELQIEEGELAGNWSPVMNAAGQEVVIFFYDLLPGGAGYTQLFRRNLLRVLEVTKTLLDDCDCESSCYKCLRHYRNSFIHHSLDRHLALTLLNHVMTGEVPALTEAQKRSATSKLEALATLQGLRTAVRTPRGPLVVPMVIARADGSEVWVEVTHPLYDTSQATSVLASGAASEFVEYVALDTHSVAHDLPTAWRQLQL